MYKFFRLNCLKSIIVSGLLLTNSFVIEAQQNSNSNNKIIDAEFQKITLQPNEKVWGGFIFDGDLMPFKNGYKADLLNQNKSNQSQPLLLTNKGQYAWSEEPFRFEIQDSVILIFAPKSALKTGKQGNSLAEVQQFASKTFFPASGNMPDSLFFTCPQYNTWIELTYNQNQADVLKYAQGIIDNGLPAGVLMIDASWQEDYGVWDFNAKRFPTPKLMIEKLHEMGFKVMLWVCPFISPDRYQVWQPLQAKKALLQAKINAADTWESASQQALVNWWDGYSNVLDLSNPEAVKWFNIQLDRLVSEYKVDGFKFDAGDMPFYPENTLNKGNVSANEQCRLYAEIGLRFPLNEFRACWKMGGQALVQRLQDKEHNWSDLQKLIPQLITQNLMGYTFSCPDMIGGGNFISFLNDATIDQDLVVRSAQCHALMTMMQFSVAPWRVLDKTHFEAVKKAVLLRQKFIPTIMNLARKSAITGEPILKNMDYCFPNQGYAEIKDQFMLGDKILVAPLLEKGKTERVVMLPKGNWIADDGKKFKGGKSYSIHVPLDRLPYFICT